MDQIDGMLDVGSWKQTRSRAREQQRRRAQQQVEAGSRVSTILASISAYSSQIWRLIIRVGSKIQKADAKKFVWDAPRDILGIKTTNMFHLTDPFILSYIL